ncbi:hypothetical protein [Halobaculum lipolyticum]|uniref:SipW-cognate class signal peptide n=1 Tax=Halobaculum lipolyticum TaxID=3032001 RepID=A0ABD5WEQ7_9EURY|nr:hypothetical protein [Halobaculum sp. DT31]
MSDDNMSKLTRRSVLGGVATLGIAGAGVASFTGTVAGASSTLSISSGDADVANDRGDVSRVTADPSFTVDWDGLDDAVGKVFFLLEARVGDQDEFSPLYRATPWLGADEIGTAGSFTRPNSENGGLGPLVVADEDGEPDYTTFDFSNLGGVDLGSYLDGTSMSSSDNYVPGGPSPDSSTVVVPSDQPMQNNYPNADAGYYGAASDTAPFDNGDPTTTGETVVALRYTVELQRPNLSQLKYRVDYEDIDGVGSTDEFQALPEGEQKSVAAEQIDGLEVSDIDDGNSTIVMNGEDGNYEFDTPSGIPYSEMQNNADDHVGILTDTTEFTVSVTNQPDTSGGSGSSNSEAN